LSRSHPNFIKSLFMLEAPEIESGVVEIKSVAREAGARSKIAVMSHDEHVDPVGACVGQRGTRVTAVMNELNGEKIDIIPWSEDPKELVANAIAPAQALNITILEDEHRALVEVAEDQLSLAIGKGGQNVRLAAKLTGWRIDIKGQEGSRTEQEPDAFDASEGEVIHNSGALKEAIETAVDENDAEEAVNADAENMVEVADTDEGSKKE
jgi:N utilization substance protein A